MLVTNESRIVLFHLRGGHSLLGLQAHLLPPLPPQLHAAIKVIVHDAQKMLLTLSLKDAMKTRGGSVNNKILWQ